MANNRLQMLLRFSIDATKEDLVPVDDLIANLAMGLCEPEFLYEAITELRRDDQVDIIATNNTKIALLSEKGRRVLDFDRKIFARIDIVRHAAKDLADKLDQQLQ